jgi:hypothetical protein
VSALSRQTIRSCRVEVRIDASSEPLSVPSRTARGGRISDSDPAAGGNWCHNCGVKRTNLEVLLTPKWWSFYTLIFVGLPVANLVWIATTTDHDLGGPTGVVVVPAVLIAAGWIAIWRRRQ